MNTKAKIKKIKNKGFTVIELLLVLSIFAIVTTITMANYSDFGQKTMLKNLAYSIGLIMREAQVSGLSGRNISIESGKYNLVYGVYFTANSTEFKTFVDVNQNHIFDNNLTEYNPALGVGALHKVRKAGQRITRLYIYDNLSNSWIQVPHLHISFKRPEPDAIIYTDTTGPYAKAAIEVVNSKGDKLYTVVNLTGQISVVKCDDINTCTGI